jgi:ATP-dependent protease ClpP protease subunit
MKPVKHQVLYDVHDHGVNLDLRDIYLHSYYVEDEEFEPGVDYRQATTFIKNLHLLDSEPYSPILVHLHSTGGCWDNGMAIYNSVEAARSPVTMLAYAQASSMSGIVFQCAKTRVMMPDCHFMMHHGWTYGPPQHPFSFKTEADYEIRKCERMLEIFAKRALVGEFFKKRKNSTESYAYSYFDKKIKAKVDWYLTAEEAVFYGLADGILGSAQFKDIQSLRSGIDESSVSAQN